MRRSPLLASVGLVVVSCAIGPQVSSFAPAIGPAGARVSIDSASTSFRAELLAVTDTGFLLLHGGTVEFASYAAIGHASFPDLDSRYDVGGRQRPDSMRLATLRLVSRFPQGVPAGLLTRVLAAYHQDSLRLLRP